MVAQLLLFPFRLVWRIASLCFWTVISILAFTPLLLCAWVYVGFLALLTDQLPPMAGLMLFFISGTVFSLAQMLQRQRRIGRVKPPKSRSQAALRHDPIRQARQAKVAAVRVCLKGKAGGPKARRLCGRLPRHLRMLM